MAEAFEVKASSRHVPVSPQKIRLVCDVVRGKGAEESLDTLRFMPQKPALFISWYSRPWLMQNRILG